MELFLKQHKSVVPRVIQACVECKRRKGKCVGNPCTHCISKKLVCVFPEAKKRGPKFKSQISTKTNVQVHGFQFMHDIQMNLNNLYQQSNLVDFYFDFLGVFVPMPFKSVLLAPTHNDSLKSQLYIIFAHIVMMFGNTELEQQFIAEAQKHVNIFTQCDTIESAVCMLMMSLYLGHENAKSPMYASISHNITKLPNVINSLEASKVNLVASAMSVDHTIPRRERMARVCAFLPLSPAGLLNQHEWILCSIFRLRFMLFSALELDMEPYIVIANLNKEMFPDQRDALLDQAQVVEKLGLDADPSWPIKIFAMYSAAIVKCIVYWRVGQLQEALAYAQKTADITRENSNAIALWNHDSITKVIVLPYFLKQYGLTELYEEQMSILNKAFSKLIMYKDFLQRCEQYQLQIPGNYKFEEIVQDLLGDSPLDSPLDMPPLDLDLDPSDLLNLDGVPTE